MVIAGLPRDDPNDGSQFGLKYDKNNKKIKGDVWGNGRHFAGKNIHLVTSAGIGMAFIQYPQTTIIFEFSDSGGADVSTFRPVTMQMNALEAWTANGQTVNLDLSFFTRITDESKLTQFYYNFGENWKGYFVRLAQVELKDLTTTFDELDFYNERERIKNSMLETLNTAFYSYSNGVLNVTDVQLRTIGLANELEQAVQNKIIELQAQRKWAIQQEISVINKETELIDQWASNNITITYANATAEALIIKSLAEAEGVQTEYEGYATAWRDLEVTVVPSYHPALFSLMFTESLSRMSSNANLVLGF